ncbi:uncharacterized protein PHACADRAFT_146900 [Phanerochaete carnosa HHB-10118-sp]|uniref:Uncharacterized protein n=1 Tax=Phanerochaete carnosa (strain HHB-10118-sp) TaxID=650164 RepID=K5W6B6_PHACS|nr:uncharacterized protein PHACADRAFT_146900 [Phanerochaete carnosa HHB-10118-sp]EKM54700.1 hypothetical protein PHACADRAFT_146900 [Phanerochaete carnosa HHB-10118-sp]
MVARFNLRYLRNVSYHHPRLAILGPHDRDHWTLSCNNIEGVSLADIRAGRFRLQELTGYDDALFPASFSKVTVLILIHGFKVFRRVKNVQCVRHGVPVPVPRHKVVRCIAEVMLAFLDQVSTMVLSGPTDDHDGSFMFGPGGVQIEHLYLLELHRYGKTLIPVFGYTPPDAGLTVMVFGQ